MTALNRSTSRRLKKLRQVPSVWEGDRRALSPDFAVKTESGEKMHGECILWVDGTEGVVRAMSVVPADAGIEAVVRTLLQAMEFPQSSVSPSRPQKIVVRDRELQFFLRGVLQDLDIVVDYVPELPLIDEIFRGLMSMGESRPPELPPEYAKPILEAVQEIWFDAPWQLLDEEKIISVELNYSDVGTLYISILGMLGMEYGLLMYRSIDSLKKFRQQVLTADNAPERLEEAFLEQDCLFLTFDEADLDEFEMDEPDDLDGDDLDGDDLDGDDLDGDDLDGDDLDGNDLDDNDLDGNEPGETDLELAALKAFALETGMRPSFGNLHPLEGMRPALYEEEAAAVLVALSALHRFFDQHLENLDTDHFPEVNSRYRIADPREPGKKVAVKVATLPQLAQELAEMVTEVDDDDDDDLMGGTPVLRNDLVPTDAFYSLGAMPWETLEVLRTVVKYRQSEDDTDFPKSADGFPVVLIQTSRPKATELIEGLKAAGGVKGICFNPGEDPFSDNRYDLGVLQANNGELHLFGEFIENDPIHIQARKKWDQRCKKTKGYCGLVIARGLKGSSRGNPQLSDMMALFEVRFISEKELGLGPLQLMPYFE